MVADGPRQHAVIARAKAKPLAVVAASLLIAHAAFLAGCASHQRAADPRPRGTASLRDAAKTDDRDAREAVPFIHDDAERAIAEAKRTKRPLFVDAWAPWCHSCQSMRAYVLSDRALAPLANDFVWLSIDTDKPSNSAFVERFTNRVWPTLWVLDAERGATVLRWEGTATAPELVTLLAMVKDGAREGAAEASVAFLRASQAASRGDAMTAERAYREMLGRRDFPERARVIEALVGLLAAKKDHAACAELALVEAPRMAPGTSRATALATGLSCARDGNLGPETWKLAEEAQRVAADPDPRTLADDRSALFEEVLETRKAQGDEAAAKRLARSWASFLEREASAASTKQGRAVFDAHRLSAYLAAGEPERAVPMLVQSERDFPEDYNAPARLARAYLAMKQMDDARAAVARASSRVYGARSLRVFSLAADIAKARGDASAERAALEQALTRTERAVLNDSQKKLRAELDKRLRELR